MNHTQQKQIDSALDTIKRLNSTINSMHKHLHKAVAHLDQYDREEVNQDLCEAKALASIKKALSHTP
jgi:hypothetical protein